MNNDESNDNSDRTRQAPSSASALVVPFVYGAVHENEIRSNSLLQLASSSTALKHVVTKLTRAFEAERARLEAISNRCVILAKQLDALEKKGSAKVATLVESSARYRTTETGQDNNNTNNETFQLLRPLFESVCVNIEEMDETLNTLTRTTHNMMIQEYNETVSKKSGLEGLNGLYAGTSDQNKDSNHMYKGSNDYDVNGTTSWLATAISKTDDGDGAKEILKLSMTEKIRASESEGMNMKGLGHPPTLRSVSDLLLFNTNINMYRSHDATVDSLNNDSVDDDDKYIHDYKEDEIILSDAPISVTDGDSLPIVAVNEIGFKPTLGPVPELQLPSELPELSMAADISWKDDSNNAQMTTIAPSAMAEALPDLDFSVGSVNDSHGHSDDPGRENMAPPPPPQPPQPPPLPATIPPPPPNPLPSIQPQQTPPIGSSSQAESSQTLSTSSGTPSPPIQSGRAALLDEIRNPGMSLRKVETTEDDSTESSRSQTVSSEAAPPDPHSALMAAVLSKKNVLRKLDTTDEEQTSVQVNPVETSEKPVSGSSNTLPSKDPHSDLMSAIKNRGSISLKPASEPNRPQRSQSLPPNKAGGDIMSQLADDLKKRRVSIATGGAKEQGSDGGDNNGGDKSDGILGLSEYLASVDEEDSDDDDWDDDD